MNRNTRYLEEFYKENSVFKTLAICGTDESAAEFTTSLENNDHSVATILHKEISKDTYNIVYDFSSADYRILVISYPAWKFFKEEIATYILPYQNLFVLNDIDDDCEIPALQYWFQSARAANLIKDTTVLNLDLIS
jgi:hypothetical protein